ncbi:MAG: hypothetical protein RHS_2010 [Robinsoniella sp. RHS]|nr:MAG: hypothetical protein RHS_2010 [Robinsoniella sp. RHS]
MVGDFFKVQATQPAIHPEIVEKYRKEGIADAENNFHTYIKAFVYFLY